MAPDKSNLVKFSNAVVIMFADGMTNARDEPDEDDWPQTSKLHAFSEMEKVLSDKTKVPSSKDKRQGAGADLDVW